MTSLWRDIRLGDFVTLQRGHDLPDQDRRPGRVPIMGSFGVTGFHDTAKTKGPGVTIGRSGGSFGVVNYCVENFWPLNTALYVTDFRGNDPRFVYYFLRSIDFSGFNSGSAQPSLNRNYIYPIPIRVPDAIEQRRIADILGTLDDKIELNRRMNETLEAMARALFKSWFIDFDPVHAKAAVCRQHPDWSNAQVSRAALPNLAAEIAELFPDKFAGSSLGRVPAGWSVGELRDVAEVVMGSSPSGETYNELAIGLPLVNGPVEFGEYFAVKKKWTTDPQRLSKCDDLIFCVRGSTTGRRVIADDVYCLGRGVCAIRSNCGANGFIYALIDSNLDRLLAKVTGSVFPNLNGPDIRRFQVLIPPTEIIVAHEQAVVSIHQTMSLYVKESESISTIRDALLPKLLNGEVPVLAFQAS